MTEVQGKDVNVTQMLQDIAALVAERAGKKRVTLTLRVAFAIPHLAVDEATIKRMCYNLLEHAITFARVGGQIVIAAGPRPGAMPGEDFVVVIGEDGPAVADTTWAREDRGHEQLGVAPAGPRTQAGRLLESTRNLVEAHGGTLWATRDGGMGNTLAFRLPTRPRLR